MDIHIYNFPEQPKQPERPKPGVSPNLIRRIFKEREVLFDFLVKCGWTEDEASKMVLADAIKK